MGKEEFTTKVDVIAQMVLEAGAMTIRDVDEGEEPFLYASGNWGPGYVTIKSLVGRKKVIRSLVQKLAEEIRILAPHIDFVAGNVTGGLVPGWILSECLEPLLNKTIPFVYIRDARKKGGHKELITGLANNTEISLGDNCLVVEELVNFAQTTCNSVEVLRNEGYTVTHTACILFYKNPKAVQLLQEHDVKMVYLFDLPNLLDVAYRKETHSKKLITAYREFLKNPLAWQEERGLKPVEGGGTK